MDFVTKYSMNLLHAKTCNTRFEAKLEQYKGESSISSRFNGSHKFQATANRTNK